MLFRDEMTQANPSAAPNPARASQFHFERRRRRVGEPSRWHHIAP
jgi:hypothetical protein